MKTLSILSIAIKKYFQNYNGLPKICWTGIFLIFIDAVAGGVCFFLSLYFVNDLHLNVAVSSLLISLYGLGTVAGGMIGGKLSDTMSTKLLTNLSLLFQAIAFLILIKINSVEMLMLNLFVIGFASYTFKTAVNCWMLRQLDNNSELKLKTLNIARVASNLGLGVSGTVIGIFAEKNFFLIFLLSGILFFVAALSLTFQQQTSTAQRIITESHSNFTDKNNKKTIAIILLFVFLIGLIIGQLGTTYPLFIQDTFKNLGIKAVSLLFILDTVLIVIFQAPLVNFFQNSNKIFMMGAGGLLMGLGMLILNFSSIFFLAVISCIIWTTGEMLFIPLTQLLCYEKGLSNKKGQSIGTYQAIYAASTICGPLLGGMTYQYFGGKTLWYVSGFIGLSCFLVCNFIKKHA
jgi:predicted MFS family arabinose efflux permease